MGKTILLLLVAAVVGSTYLATNQATQEFDSGKSHVMVQAEAFAEDMANNARSAVLGGALEDGSLARWPANIAPPIRNTETQWFGGGMSAADSSTQWKVNRYTVNGDALSFVVTGKSYYTTERQGGSLKPLFATHSIRSEYALQSEKDDDATPPCATVDVLGMVTPLSCAGAPDLPDTDITPREIVDKVTDPDNPLPTCGPRDTVLAADYTTSHSTYNYGYGGSTPSIVRTSGSLTVAPGHMFKGQGLLVVNGDLVVEGNLMWKGIVLVHGEASPLNVDFGNGHVTVDGSFLVQHTAEVPSEQELIDELLEDPSYGVMLDQGDHLTITYGAEHVSDALDCLGFFNKKLIHLGSYKTTPDDEETGVPNDNGSDEECESYNNGGGNGIDCAPGNSGNTPGDDADGSNTPGTIDTSGGSTGNGGNGNGGGRPGNGNGNSGNGHSNNGHGNNADGVDVSNPGQGHGGPNGEIDESCDGTGECVDDENGNGNGGGGNGNGNGNGGGNGGGNGNGRGNR